MSKAEHEIKMKHVAVRKRAKDPRMWRWRAVCICGWNGQKRKRKGAARNEGTTHLEATSA